MKGHLHPQPGALSDVKVTFGRGGPVQTAINYLIGPGHGCFVDRVLGYRPTHLTSQQPF